MPGKTAASGCPRYVPYRKREETFNAFWRMPFATKGADDAEALEERSGVV